MFAAVEMAMPWPLLGFGEVHVSSSLAAILIAAVPLFVALLATRFDHSERPTPTRLVGMLIGLGGVVALVGIDIGGKGDELLGALAILVVAFLYAIGPMIVKRRLSDVDPLGPVAASLGIAALLRHPVRAPRPAGLRALGRHDRVGRGARASCARRSPSCSSSG